MPTMLIQGKAVRYLHLAQEGVCAFFAPMDIVDELAVSTIAKSANIAPLQTVFFRLTKSASDVSCEKLRLAYRSSMVVVDGRNPVLCPENILRAFQDAAE